MFCLFSALSLPNLLNSSQGFVFIIEEIVGSVFLILGFLFFNPFVKKIIQKLNKHYPWIDNVGKRLLIELGAIGSLTIILAIIAILSGYIFFEAYGVPEFFEIKENLKIEQIKNHPEKSFSSNFLEDDFSIFIYKFQILIGSLLLFSFLFLIEEIFINNKYQLDKKIRDEQIQKEIAYSKVSMLQNQLNPHFMFNTLNVLTGLIHEDVEKAGIFIEKLSEIYRYVLVQSEEVVSTLENELKFSKAYIYLLKIRFDDKLKVIYNIDPSKVDWLLPSMTLELLIENAIKHNSLDSSNPLIIEIVVNDNYLIVKNNILPRMDSVTSTGIGLRNLQQRLKALDIENAEIGAIDKVFKVIFPLINPII